MTMFQTRPFRYYILLILTLLLVSACGQTGAPVTESTAPATESTAAVTTAASVEEPTEPAATAVLIDIPPTFEVPPTVELFPDTPTEEATEEATREPTEAVTSAPTEEASEQASGSETATADTTATASALGAEWSVDSDGNAIPDLLETELGADPLTDQCAAEQCGEGTLGADFLLKERNTLLMLDSSGSMAADGGGGFNKLDTAKMALNRYVQVVSGVYNLGFLVYGHKGNNTDAGKAESCVGIDLLAPLGQLQRENFEGILAQFQPTGWTPIAASLTKAGEAFAGKEDANNRIILVSDGIETCEGDPVSVARQLHEGGLALTIDVLGYGVAEDSPDAQQLRQIAEVTGGTYYDAQTAADLNNYFQQQGAALGDTYDTMVCEVGNFTQTNLCDSSLVNKALARLRDLELKAASDAEADAYQEITDRINAAYDERQQTRREAQARFEQLKDQYFNLRDQIQKALEDTYGQ
jgi:uncharacterized protein YdcH (DUF465 family)